VQREDPFGKVEFVGGEELLARWSSAQVHDAK
jgi:hypothetical protein